MSRSNRQPARREGRSERVTSATIRTLAVEEWEGYFERLLAGGDAPLVSVEAIGEQTPGPCAVVPCRHLRAAAYDPAADVLELTVGGQRAGDPIRVRHLISNPRSIKVQVGDAPRPAALVVDDASGARTQIRIYEPPATHVSGRLVGHRAQASWPTHASGRLVGHRAQAPWISARRARASGCVGVVAGS
jgi:hypothetical protein